MKCLGCGRKLNNPQSQKIGYGPVCYKRTFGSNTKQGRRTQREPPLKSVGFCKIPGQISIDDYLLESGNL